MAIAIIMLPSGFSPETKENFIRQTKLAIAEGFDFHPKAASVWLHEHPAEHMCEDAARKRVLVIYTKKKPDAYKHNVARLFDQACEEALGAMKGDSFVLFREHDDHAVGARGALKELDHGVNPAVVPTFAEYLAEAALGPPLGI